MISLIESRHKPLIVIENKVITYHKNSIYLMDIEKKTKKRLVLIPTNFVCKLLGQFRFFERLLRLEVKVSAYIDDQNILISRSGKVYKISLNDNTIKEEHSYRKDMNNPYSFTKIDGIKGFSNCIVYGEYVGRSNERYSVSIFARDMESGVWGKSYTFDKGQIRHIHNIIPDKYNNCVYILTGDMNSESGIWVAYENFKIVKPLFIGKQQFRSVVLFSINKSEIFYATDSALEQNYIFKFKKNNDSKFEISEKWDIDGSCLSGADDEKNMYFSTTVENDERVAGIRSWIDYGRSPGIKSEYAQLIKVDKTSNNKSLILELKKDIFPCRLMQYGYFCVVPIPRLNGILVYPIGLKKYDGKLLFLKEGIDY